MAVPVHQPRNGEFVTGPAARLFAARYYGGFFEGGSALNPRYFDVTPDGEFLMIKTLASGSSSMRLIVVQHWLEELKRLVPVD